SLIAAIASKPLATVALSLGAMLLAMMPPLLMQPIAHVRSRSLKERAAWAVFVFVTAYSLVWFAAMVIVAATALLLGAAAIELGVSAFLLAIAIAATWQAAPLRQRALNRCHRLPRLSAFGVSADRDCFRFGLTHGLWCAATCAPAMLLPLTTPV